MGLRLENITKFYASATNVTMALQKVSMEFGERGFVAITGESGSGKSTLISILSGMLGFEEGEIYVDGQPMSVWDDSELETYRKNKIGFVFQEYNLIDQYTVLDNVESAIRIRDIRRRNVKAYARQIIERVGLKGFENQKASKLSSGQKQRLAIGRALAKDADIIVADEPTGNLDSENGQKIMELFASISKDKLVIMVTHNYAQAEPYVDRQIRMFDGKVVSDIEVKPEVQAAEHREDADKECGKSPSWLVRAGMAWTYTLKNLIRQPVRTFFVALFVVITAVVSYIFLGEIVSHYDDTYTREYDTDIFEYENDKRIVVKKSDGSAFTEEDYKFFATIDKVVEVEEYDLCNDIRYYNIPDKDYYITYYTDSNWDTGEDENYRNVEIKRKESAKYMRSASCITQDDLAEGRLPEARNEIVIYSEDSLSNVATQKIFFQCEDVWGKCLYEYDFVVVGILKEETAQIYYSTAFCDMLTASYKQGGITLEGAYCQVAKDYVYRGYLLPMIDENIDSDEELNISSYYIPSYPVCTGMSHMMCEPLLIANGYVNVYADKLLVSGEREALSYADVPTGKRSDSIQSIFVNVSEKFFYELYDYGSHQASIYIEHYAYTDEVLEDIRAAGYDAISSYRVASIDYISEKVENRIILLLTSFVILIVVALLEVFILSSFMKLRRKFYSVFRFMGMEVKVIKQINFMEINLYTTVAVALMLIFAGINFQSGWIQWISELTVYMEPVHYLIYIIYNFTLAQIVAIMFNKYLDRKLFKSKK